MALIKITFDAASVSSKMDADINHFLTSGVSGIFYGILGRCQASVSNNYISLPKWVCPNIWKKNIC